MIGANLVTYLESEGFEGIYHNCLPDVDDTIIVVMDEAAPMLVDSVGFNVDQSGLHVLVRGMDSPGVYNVLKEIYDAVVGFYGLMDGVQVTQISPSQYPSYVDTDERQRSTYTAHFVARFTNDTAFRKDPVPPVFLTDDNGDILTDGNGIILYD